MQESVALSSRVRQPGPECSLGSSVGMGRWSVTLLLAGLMLLALLVRLAFLNSRSVWFDEAFSIHVARAGIGGIAEVVGRSDLHPPLYYFVLSLWLRFGDSPAGIRSLSAIFGTLSVALTWSLGGRIGGRVLAALSALLLATSALAIQASVEARMYALLGLLATGSTVLLGAAIRGAGSWRVWIAYAAVLDAALYTHYVALLILLAHVLYVIFSHGYDRTARFRMLGSVAGALLAYLPWWPVAAEQFARSGGEWIEKTSFTTLLNVGAAEAFGGYALGLASYLTTSDNWTWAQVVLVAPFLVLAVIGGTRARGQSLTRLVLFCWFLPVAGLVVVSLVTGSVAVRPRYFSAFQPFFTILMANGLVTVTGRLRKKWPALLSLSLAVASLNIWVVRSSYADPRMQPYDWAGAAQYVVRQWQQGDGFVFYPHHARIAFGYYVRGAGTNAITFYKLWGGLKASRKDMLRALPSVGKVLRGAKRVWVVMTIPSTVEEREAILEAVGREYSLRRFSDFRYVWVALYERSPS